MNICTAIHYTNGSPHIGHSLEFVVADVFSRWYQMRNKSERQVYFLTGTDEHGQKIEKTAFQKGMTPKEMCDQNSRKFYNLCKSLQVLPNRFIRTTDDDHTSSVHEFFKKCQASGDIYKGEYSGWYSIREECYVTRKDAELSNFKDPVTEQPLIEMKEPSYFFKLSKYVSDIIEIIESKKVKIIPEYFTADVLNRLKNNIDDLSISRPKESVSWGIPVPEDEGHTFYVWFEALINYYTGIKSKRNSFNGVDIHVIGKDIIWFHSVVWLGMLISAKLELPKCIYVHGFVCDENGQKMSKSIGNVIDPVQMIERYGTTPFRYYMLSEFSSGTDLKFSEQALVQTHDSLLLKNVGNYVSRVFSMMKKYANSEVTDYICDNNPHPNQSNQQNNIFNIDETLITLQNYIETFEFGRYCEHVLSLVTKLNTYISDTCIWQINNEKYPDDTRSEEFRNNVLRTLVEGMMIVSELLFPIIPEISMKIKKYLRHLPDDRNDNYMTISWNNFKVGHSIEGNPPKLFSILNQEANDTKMKKNMQKKTSKSK